MKYKSFHHFHIVYMHKPHTKHLIKATIRYYNNICCHCKKEFPSDQLTIQHLSYKNLFHESIGVDVICSCAPCIKKNFINPLPKESISNIIKVSIKAYEDYPKWKLNYNLVSIDKLHHTCILIPKSNLDLTKIAIGSLLIVKNFSPI